MNRPADLSSPDTALVKEAINWLVKLQGKPDDHPFQLACLAWRQISPGHELAWQRVSLMLGEMQTNLHGLPAGFQASQVMHSTMRNLQKRRSLKLLTLAGLAISSALITKEQSLWQPWLADYHTQIGERRSITLADGTELSLNTNSSVDVRFDEQQRLIVLSQGEIMIKSGADLASPLKRPLRVQTQQATLEAIGTQFVVRLQAGSTLLSMQEGRVAMRPLALGQTMQIAEPGQHYRIYPDHLDLVELPIEADSWTLGALVVKEIRLGDFIAEISRYRPGYLRCDPAVADLRFSGVFQLDDTDKLLALIAHKLPIAVQYRTRWWVQIGPKA